MPAHMFEFIQTYHVYTAETHYALFLRKYHYIVRGKLKAHAVDRPYPNYVILMHVILFKLRKSPPCMLYFSKRARNLRKGGVESHVQCVACIILSELCSSPQRSKC